MPNIKEKKEDSGKEHILGQCYRIFISVVNFIYGCVNGNALFYIHINYVVYTYIYFFEKREKKKHTENEKEMMMVPHNNIVSIHMYHLICAFAPDLSGKALISSIPIHNVYSLSIASQHNFYPCAQFSFAIHNVFFSISNGVTEPKQSNRLERREKNYNF